MIVSADSVTTEQAFETEWTRGVVNLTLKKIEACLVSLEPNEVKSSNQEFSLLNVPWNPA